MKNRAGLLTIMFFLSLLSMEGSGQECVPVSKSNDIKANQLCSPVDVIYWDVTYSGVDPSVGTVTIFYDWDDGTTETLPTVMSAGRVFTAKGIHTYVSQDDKCNYKPTATMVVDGTLCTSQWQEQIVTIWDVDDKNGAYVNASPDVYPICVGNSATVRFDDDTKYNCVPPQEEDNRNESTRWIQWVYRNKTMTGTPVSVDGYTGPWPYVTPVKELPGPSWGSDEQSLPIFVDDDKAIGQEFEVELRYWNYCNKYTDGEDPVIDKSVIRIVGLPDATIDPLVFTCEFGGNDTLTAAQGGGTWSGPGIIGPDAGIFAPSVAGTGIHSIHHEIIDENGCSAEDDTDIEVSDGPDGTITPVDPVCYGADPFDLEALTIPGTWSGSAGITDPVEGTFSSTIAGPGSHNVKYITAPDADGCYGADTTLVHVVVPPFASFLTPDSAWCQRANNSSMGSIVIFGIDTSTFDLVYEARGRMDTLFNMSADTFDLFLNNMPGENLYVLKKVIEHHGSNFCETELSDTLSMTVLASPLLSFQIGDLDYCSPVDVDFEATEGFSRYTWDFGDGMTAETFSNEVSHTFTYDYSEHFNISGSDTIYDLSGEDTLFNIVIQAETFDGCMGYYEDSITIYPKPNANFFVSPALQSHPDSLVYLVNLSSIGPWDYHWNFGDQSESDLKDPFEHIFDTWGSYDIFLEAFSEYCSDTITKSVQILPPEPSAAMVSAEAGCPPLEVKFLNNSQYADSYFWNFDDGDFSSEAEPTHTFYESREHIVTLSAFGLSGTDTTEQSIMVYDRPVAVFDAYPRESKNLKQVFKFKNNSVGGSYYLWDFGDGSTSPDEEPAHIYEDSGTYTITLYVWSEENCADTLILDNLITVKAGEGSIQFPNAFVWNGSGPSGGHWNEGTIDNTVFHPAVINATTFRMIIYTRWGEQIFESDELYVGWDGYLDGATLAEEGVYVFKAWVKYVDGYEEILAGDITFLH
ncbi:MAG: PKD domain-containing protein [Bacteroides sp.]|nr:PKD domain-containing protein [Bacteroides sp.]